MKTMTMRAVVVTGALAIGLGAAGCTKPDTPSTGSTSAASSTEQTSSGPASTTTQVPEVAAIVEKAKENALNAKSGAFTGQINQDGKSIRIDFKGTSDGTSADISIDSEGDGKARLISTPGAVYIQGDAAFWKKQGAPAKVQQAGAKFIKAKGSSAASMTQTLSLKSYLQKAFDAVKVERISTNVGSETVDGVDCWVLYDEKGKQGGALYVSKDSGDLIRFTGSPDSPGQLDFSHWNQDLGIKAPDPSQILSLS